MVWITDATYLGEYRIRLKFSDGAQGVADLRETLFADRRKLFIELRDVELFRRFRVEMDTVVWDNGLDLAPEFLRDLAGLEAGARQEPAAG